MPGVYVICNTVNDKVYVGRTSTDDNRWRQHRQSLERGTHENSHLQRAWNKYGAQSFEFAWIDDDPNTENFYLSYFRYIGVALYNTRMPPNNSAKGQSLSAESRRRLSEARRGIVFSAEHRQRLREAGQKRVLSPDWSRKGAEARIKTVAGVVAPNGTIYPSITGLRAFCKEHGLNYTCPRRVVTGERVQYKGWRRLEEETR